MLLFVTSSEGIEGTPEGLSSGADSNILHPKCGCHRRSKLITDHGLSRICLQPFFPQRFAS